MFFCLHWQDCWTVFPLSVFEPSLSINEEAMEDMRVTSDTFQELKWNLQMKLDATFAKQQPGALALLLFKVQT